MKFIDLLTLPWRYRIWRPLHIRLVVKDMLYLECDDARPHRKHLEGVLYWLCCAQDQRDGAEDAGSVAAGWSFEHGWLPGYPETTGYIIETFLAASKVLQRPDFIDRAQRMIDWELSIQHQDGAFPGHFGEPGSRPVISNTGQIMHGMVAGYVQLQRDECLESAVRAGHWLVAAQEPDGSWLRHEHNDAPHVYNTRAAWALLSTGLLAGEKALVAAARRNLDWALSQQTDSGWFADNAFVAGRSPFTHTIAYAIRGLLESGVLLGEERYLQAAEKAGQALMGKQREDGGLAGAFRDGWVADAGYCCLTGVAQMCANWLRLAGETDDMSYRVAALRGIEYLKTTQCLSGSHPGVRGGIAGSAPIWGDYSRFEYPSWAAKFFADTLMMDMTDVAIPPIPKIDQ